MHRSTAEPVADSMKAVSPSRYNFVVADEQRTPGGALLFNSAARGLLQLNGGAATRLLRGASPSGHSADTVDGADRALSIADATEAETRTLLEHGFAVPSGFDEVAALRRAWEVERGNARVYFTVAPTLACNLSCDYCFQPRRLDRMTAGILSAVVAFVKRRALASRAESLWLDWFGGEPLLEFKTVLEASVTLRRFCEDSSIAFHSTIVTNGVLLTKERAEALRAAGITRVQMTIDGTRAFHDARRHFPGGMGTFDIIWKNVVDIAGMFDLQIRINVDCDNRRAVRELIDAFANHGLLAPERRIRVIPAAVGPLTDYCKLKHEHLPPEEMAEVSQSAVRDLLKIGLSDAEVIDTDPARLILDAHRGGCKAFLTDSFVIGPLGHLFKCELTLHNEDEAVGRVQDDELKPRVKALPWQSFNPYDIPVCRECRLAPLCRAGCGLRRMRGETAFLDGACTFWNRNITAFIQRAARLDSRVANSETQRWL